MTNRTDAPGYELRRLKVVRALSDETTCFAADIYADGRRIGAASNRGHGGPNEWHIEAPADVQVAFEAAARAWAAGEGVEFEPVESFIDQLREDVANRKAAKRHAAKGYPVTGLIRVGDDPLEVEFYVCAARDRAGIEREAARLKGTVRRWYDESAGERLATTGKAGQHGTR